MPSPLSIKAKTAFIEKLKNHTNVDELKIALSKAVCDGLIFPSPIEESIRSLRQAYQDNKNASAEIFLKKAIDSVVDENIFSEFSKLLQTNPQECPSVLIHFLAQQLNIFLDEPRLVQVAIKDGKIYWRVKEGTIIIYDRQTAKEKRSFQFTEENSLEMTWEQFREFKDTGKRYGTVKITLERFTGYFIKEIHNQAEAVWEELKRRGILDRKNRFSGAWRMANENIFLKALTDEKWVISKDALIDILKELRGKKKTDKFTYQYFIQACKNKFQHINKHQFHSIFNLLCKENVLFYNSTADLCMVISLVFKGEDIVLPFQLSYEDVVVALYGIANDKKYAELIRETKTSIYRPERCIKSWGKEPKKKEGMGGLVYNSQPDSEENCVKLWDVSLNKDLTAHRNTSDEIKQYKEKLNYDHVPSSDRLRTFSSEKMAPLEDKIKLLAKQLKNVRSKLTYEYTEEEFSELEQSETDLEENLSEERALLKAEKERYGNAENWFSVAIPEKLHHQGESYMRSSTEQKRDIKEPFVQEFEAYIAMLTKRAQDFGFDSQTCVFFLIAAFRHLYRCQVKKPQTSHFGQAPYLFFQAEVKRAELDQMILSETKKILSVIG